MILIDFNQIAIATVAIRKLNDEDMIRHMILNSIRMYNKKYRDEYGQMVICCDGPNTWRREYFPEYKANRKKGRDNSELDWNAIFKTINLIRDEISTNLPYKVIQMDGCEADDIIGTLVLETQEFGKDEPVKIISSDKDFIQLHRFKNVSQFSPMQKKEVKDSNPRTYLFSHIMKGDSGDGVPNVKSADNIFVEEGLRQTPVRAKEIEAWLDNSERLSEVMDSEVYRNYQRNKTLIDLNEIPENLSTSIINKFNNTKKPMQMKVLNYLIKKRCNQLIECVEEFYNNG